MARTIKRDRDERLNITAESQRGVRSYSRERKAARKATNRTHRHESNLRLRIQPWHDVVIDRSPATSGWMS